MIRKNPEPPELDYAENPALANWPSLERNRAVFTGDVAEEIEYKSIQLGPTGFSGGPRVRILGDFRYRTAEGKRRPFRGTTLFTWTSKMSCPSFSLPAGPVEHGGTCPASRRQSIEREGTYTAHHESLESAPAGSKFICDVCLTGETLIPVRGRGLIRFDQVVSEFLDKEARLEVLADTGWVGVTNAWRKGPRKVIRINSTCGMKLRLTSDHKVLTTDGWVKASDLEPGNRLEVAPKYADLDYRKPWSSRRYAVVESVLEEPKEDEVYDIEVDHENHRFVANGIVVSNCYAGKGRYLMYKSMSLGQVAKLRWVQRTLRSGTFVRRMSEAVGSLFDRRVEETLARKLVSNRFFRIHDSGDFFSPEYYRAWVEVAWNFTGKGGQTGHPLVYFWAPTRMWVYQKWRTLFENYPPPPNLALRPSALFTSAQPPSIGGLAEGSTSIDGRMPAPVWNCPAYEGNEEHSCAAARCRVCWTRKSKPVNYLTH